MAILTRLSFVVLLVIATASTASAEVRLTIQGGHVTLVAKNATVRQILAEWERVGQTKVVNAERIQGGPLNLELTDVPERQALDIVLRSASGVVLAPRVAALNLSAFERIIVMPPSVAPASSSAPTPQPPAFGQPVFGPVQQPPMPNDEDDRVNPGVPPQNRGPVFVFPQPTVNNPGQSGGLAQPQMQPQPQMPPLVFPQQGGAAVVPPTAAYPGAPTSPTPAGVSVPGMMVPVPRPQPGQPGFQPPLQPPPPNP